MKYSIYYFLLILSTMVTVSSCVDDSLVEYTEGNLQRNDPLKQVLVNTPVVAFIAGESGYGIEFLVITPDNDDTKTVNVFATYSVPAQEIEADEEILLGSYEVLAGQNTTLIQDQLTYEQLRSGVTVNGVALPEDPVAIPVGALWTLRLEPVNADGSEAFTAPNIRVAVQSPFAGVYTVIESSYFRIGVDNGGWNGSTRIIGSVDENTFSHVDAWGPFEPNQGAVGQFVFDLNEDNTFTILDDPSQLFFTGNAMLTCQEDSDLLSNVPCEESNVLEPSPDGKHIIKLTYGYFTDGSGPREFYEVLQKK